MKRKNFRQQQRFLPASIASGAAVAQTSGSKQQNPETIRPDISALGTSTGGDAISGHQIGSAPAKGQPV
jgi:hypothetical protein